MRINKNKILWVGGYLKNTLIDTDYLKADVVNAAYIQTLEIIAKNIKTAASGKRVEITEAANNIRIYDPSGNVVIALDDDCALEERIFHANAVPPFYENIYGPGIRVGNSVAQSSSIGRRGLLTTNPTGAKQHLIGADSVGKGKVQLDVEGGMTLVNVPAAWDAAILKSFKVGFDYDVNNYPILVISEIV